jgi:hypothetical protein
MKKTGNKHPLSNLGVQQRLHLSLLYLIKNMRKFQSEFSMWFFQAFLFFVEKFVFYVMLGMLMLIIPSVKLFQI